MGDRAREHRATNGVVGYRCADYVAIARQTILRTVAGVVLIACTGGALAQSNPTDAAYRWQLPPGFPEPLTPAGNPMSNAKVQLGCRLFFDTRLSVSRQYACASCHRPELAFTDGRKTAIGATGEVVRRNAMSLTNVAYNAAFTWASRETRTLESQMTTPLFGAHPVEMGLRADDDAFLKELALDAGLAKAFGDSFPTEPTPVTMINLVKAIAAFERTLISGRSPFDRYVYDDERDALSDSARRGMNLFFSARAGCADCHSGINFSGSIVHRQTESREAAFANTALYSIDERGAYPAVDRGLIEETRHRHDMGKFRVPTLRNIALTAPYMHDGGVATLEDAIAHYAAGGRARYGNPLVDSLMRPLDLSAQDREDLIAFLKSLTDEEFVGKDWSACRSR
jgi:cytochrome c peroxidase